MYTKFEPCKSCEGVMEQFIQEVNKLGVNVVMYVFYEEASSHKKSRLRKGAGQHEA
ncbi:hypothetical protein D3C75_1209480 [compost metagenome]